MESMIKKNDDAHLDIGCGSKPRNPYGRKNIFAVDIYESSELPANVTFKQANLFTSKIPFDDNSFDSVSAYDFLEHVPRVLSSEGGQTRLPFVMLMNEVWRVLKPGGMFYAIMPVYPHQDLFKDPTHVNFMTDETHEYFSGQLYAKPYGFTGDFQVVRVEKVYPRLERREGKNWRSKVKSGFRRFFRWKHKSHLVWELRAVKPAV